MRRDLGGENRKAIDCPFAIMLVLKLLIIDRVLLQPKLVRAKSSMWTKRFACTFVTPKKSPLVRVEGLSHDYADFLHLPAKKANHFQKSMSI